MNMTEEDFVLLCTLQIQNSDKHITSPLGIVFDQSISFKAHVKTLCRKQAINFKLLPVYPVIHGHWKIKTVNESVRFVLIELLSTCLDVL